MVPNAGIQLQVAAQLGAGDLGELLGNFAVGVLEVAEDQRLVAFLVASLDASRLLAVVSAIDAEGTTLNRAFAARGVRFLVDGLFSDERACLVGAGHHAIPATDAQVLVDQHDAIHATE